MKLNANIIISDSLVHKQIGMVSYEDGSVKKYLMHGFSLKKSAIYFFGNLNYRKQLDMNTL